MGRTDPCVCPYEGNGFPRGLQQDSPLLLDCFLYSRLVMLVSRVAPGLVPGVLFWLSGELFGEPVSRVTKTVTVTCPSHARATLET